MPITSDIQKLEPGARVRLFELDCTEIGGDVLRFHPYPAPPITFQGLTYEPWPVEAENLERTGDIQQPSPTLHVSNIYTNDEGRQVVGIISSLCLALQDLVGAKLTVRETLAKYLDDSDEADPAQELPRQIWYIEQRIDETPGTVSFELAGALTLDGLRLPLPFPAAANSVGPVSVANFDVPDGYQQLSAVVVSGTNYAVFRASGDAIGVLPLTVAAAASGTARIDALQLTYRVAG